MDNMTSNSITNSIIKEMGNNNTTTTMTILTSRTMGSTIKTSNTTTTRTITKTITMTKINTTIKILITNTNNINSLLDNQEPHQMLSR